ncbi:Clp protease N-terminal domain-containing protein [Candidatus Saccharibacteria bacterium]|nr:MAG: Clp protease N-terminal domain-containing protein [Candidatus Saccharibacteria bacterium]
MQPDYQEFSNYLTENARQSLAHAGTIARGLGDAYIGTEHLLLGLMAQDGSLGGKILEDAGVTLSKAQVALKLTPKTSLSTWAQKAIAKQPNSLSVWPMMLRKTTARTSVAPNISCIVS